MSNVDTTAVERPASALSETTTATATGQPFAVAVVTIFPTRLAEIVRETGHDRADGVTAQV